MQKFILIYFIGINVASFVLMTFDKFKARIGGKRVPENTLHLLSLLGGFVGMSLSMSLFRHKTGKLSFLLKHSAIILVWIVLIFVYFTQFNELNFLG
ncbi:DUF1294 domain-containing protein [bacterium]|nr:DUF1294 domain-containing protein [bacterium]MBU1991033.1 DUF1294 domain-containing protein [bacterium]